MLKGRIALGRADAWTQAIMRKVLCGLLACACLASPSMTSQSFNTIQLANPGTMQPKPALSSDIFAGQWTGGLDIGADRLPLYFLMFRNKEGVLSVTILGLNEGTAANSVEPMGDKVRFELPSIGASFQGKINTSGSEINGEWKQGQASLPLVLQRAGSGGGVIGGIVRSFYKGPPASLGGFEDEASFSFLVDEKSLGTMQSSWARDGNFESRTEVTRAGQTVHIFTKITPDAEGRWAKIVTETPLNTVTMAREGNKIAYTVGKITKTSVVNKDVLLFDSNSPALISQALRAYDRSKGGAQKFSVLNIPQDEEDLTLEARETTEFPMRGQNLSLTRFQYSFSRTDLSVLADSAGKIYLVEWPARKTAFVRKGYESLRHVEAHTAKN